MSDLTSFTQIGAKVMDSRGKGQAAPPQVKGAQAGIGSSTSGKGVPENESCVYDAAQDKAGGTGSGNVGGPTGQVNKGASGEGKSAVSLPADRQGGVPAMEKNHGRPEMGVHPGALFPNIHD